MLVVDSALDPPDAAVVCAASRVAPEAVNFMAMHARGLVCLAMPRERMRRLGIPLMGGERGDGVAYGASIEARRGVSTGISASDRATTILAAVQPEASSADIVMPGHVTPLQVVGGGTLMRAAVPEAASDLSRLAGTGLEAVVCQVLGADGNQPSMPELEAFAAAHGLPVLSVTEVIQLRLRSDTLVRRVAEAMVPLRHGPTFRAIVYASSIDQQQHMALVLGEVHSELEVLVRK